MVYKRIASLRGEVPGPGNTGPAVTSRCNSTTYLVETQQQHQEHDRRAMAGSLLNVGVTTEVETKPVAG